MQWITELAHNHSNGEIWIAGSGPSLDSYPDDFLDNRFAITLHNAYLKFPNTEYRYANEGDRIRDFKKHSPAYFDKKCIFAYPFYRENQPEMEKLIDLDNPNYYFLILRPLAEKATNIRFLEKKIFEARQGLSLDFGGHATCLHACIYAVLMMGVTTINIIGCDHSSKDGQQHFSKANQFARGSNYLEALGAKQERGTTALMQACKNQGIIINRFKDYENLA